MQGSHHNQMGTAMSSWGDVTAMSKYVTSHLCVCLGEIIMACADHRSKQDVKATYIQSTATFKPGSNILYTIRLHVQVPQRSGSCQCQTTWRGSCLAVNSMICTADVIHITISSANKPTTKKRSKFETNANVFLEASKVV